MGLGLGYLDCSGARRPAGAAPAQRLRTHMDRRPSSAVFRDQDRPPHGDCDRDRKPGGLARDLYSAGRARDGALLLRVTRPSVGSRGRNDRSPRVYPTVPAGAVRWKLCGPAGWTSGHLSFSGLVSGRKVDVLRRGRWRQPHLWRQKFPDGAPEQITFGPLEEEGIALAPDGRSLVTSVGTRRSAIWIHDAAGERAISSEGYASAPRLSRDGTRVFYLFVRDWWLSAGGWVPASAELRSVDLASGKTDSVLPGVRHGLRYFARRERSGLHDHGRVENRRFGWRPSTGARHLARSLEPEIRCPSALTEISSSGRWRRKRLVRIKKDGSGRERITTARSWTSSACRPTVSG